MAFKKSAQTVSALLRKHFDSVPLQELTTSSRSFPSTARVDLQIALEKLLGGQYPVEKIVGVHSQWSHNTVTFSDLTVESENPVLIGPQQFVEESLGDDRTVRCLRSAVWLGAKDAVRFAVLLSADEKYGRTIGTHIEVAVAAGEAAANLANGFFRDLESAIFQSGAYRGKVLSLEADGNFRGQSSSIKVHKLRAVAREEVVLPGSTLALLERNIMRFVEQRDRLKALRLPVKKGLLFYGPPGTGKTHTIHYLAGALPGHTTLLVTAGQVGLLSEYMQLARFLQPAIVVLEDVDLIARDRRSMHGPCEESLLNYLLNEMDGLREDSEILFILTTNRPEQLEPAIASRPGRIDQAIEFPLPDDEGRAKLIRLYARDLVIEGDVFETVVRRTERGSAALIKELMRRAGQFAIENGRDRHLAAADIDSALGEMLFAGGTLNARLLGIELPPG